MQIDYRVTRDGKVRIRRSKKAKCEMTTDRYGEQMSVIIEWTYFFLGLSLGVEWFLIIGHV